jgi:hypothetical protein
LILFFVPFSARHCRLDDDCGINGLNAERAVVEQEAEINPIVDCRHNCR